MRMRVPNLQGTGAEQLVVAVKSHNWDGAKGLYCLFLLVGQPISGERWFETELDENLYILACPARTGEI